MAVKYYTPRIRRDLITKLYHEARRRGIPMTRLTDELLSVALSSDHAKLGTATFARTKSSR